MWFSAYTWSQYPSFTDFSYTLISFRIQPVSIFRLSDPNSCQAPSSHRRRNDWLQGGRPSGFPLTFCFIHEPLVKSYRLRQLEMPSTALFALFRKGSTLLLWLSIYPDTFYVPFMCHLHLWIHLWICKLLLRIEIHCNLFIVSPP